MNRYSKVHRVLYACPEVVLGRDQESLQIVGMRIVCALFMLLVGVVANAADQVSTGGGLGVVRDPYLGSCGTLIFSADGTYENAYAWQYGGVVAPLYGAFAERFDSAGLIVCGIVMDLTQTGNDAGQTCDLYPWHRIPNRLEPRLGRLGPHPGDRTRCGSWRAWSAT